MTSNTDSGHGGQTKDLDGDEADGYDEGEGFVWIFEQGSTLSSSNLPRRLPGGWTYCG